MTHDQYIQQMLRSIEKIAASKPDEEIDINPDFPQLSAVASGINMLSEEIRRQAEQNRIRTLQLEKGRQQLGNILTSIQTGIVIIDEKTHEILYVNPKAEEMARSRSEDMVGQICHSFICPKGKGDCPISDHGMKVCDQEKVLLTSDVEEVPIMKTVVEFEYQDKTCLLESMVDISGMKIKEAQLLVRETELSLAMENFEEIFNHMSDGVAVYEAVDEGNDFIFSDFNKAAETINRIRKKEVIGRKVTEVFPGIDEIGLLEVMKEVWQTGQPKHLPQSYYKDDNIEGYRENYVYRVSSGQIISIHSDITERIRAEQELKLSKERFELAVKGSTQGIWDWNLSRNEFFLSPEWKQKLGYKDEGPITEFKVFLRRLQVEDRKVFLENVNAYLKSGKGKYEDEFRLLTGGGDFRWILCRGAAIWKRGKPFRIAGSLTDITELKQTQEDLNLAREKAVEANQAKSIFLANMSHEIRTPMNAILGFSELLETQLKDPVQQEFVQSIQSSGKTLLRLINDILDLSKIEAGKLDLDLKAVNPFHIFRDMQTVFRFKVEEKGLQFITEIEEDIPQALVLDEVRLRQVLLNLIGNAVKFTDRGHIKLAVTRKYTKDDRSSMDLIFSVQDTGIGIPEEQLDSIFQEFKQVDGQDQNRYGGTGLGLAITQRLIGMMQGDLTVSSRSDPSKGQTGSKFKVILRKVNVSSVPADEGNDSLSGESDFRFKPARVLVVDDVAVNRALIRGYLDETGLEMFEAENGEVACQKVFSQPPDLVLMDLKMPVMDGYEATLKIKNKQLSAGVPVVALTASIFGEEEKRIRERKFDGYLRKPIGRLELLKELKKYLEIEEDGSPAQQEKEKEKQNQRKVMEEINDSLQVDFDKVLHALETRFLPELESIRSSFILDRIGAFAKELMDYIQPYGLLVLEEWCGKVERQACSFDMEKLPVTLNEFEKLIEAIRLLKRLENE